MQSSVVPRWVALGPLRAIELPAPECSPTIVCMHGYGANAQDLLPIGMEMELSRPARWLFPGAPLGVPQLGPESRAWFPIDERSMAELQLTGKRIDMSERRPVGFDDAIHAAEEMIEAIRLPMSKIILGGFSQGAMMAVELASRAKEKPLGLFILSGTLVDAAGLAGRLAGLTGLQFFQSHGSADPILDFQLALKLHDTLQQAGLKGVFHRFEGPHAVPPDVIDGLQAYLNSVLPKAETRV